MPSPLAVLAPADELLPALLDLSLSGVIAYQPLFDATGQVVDFTFAYVNAAAQRLLHLPARPTATYGQQFGQATTAQGFALHRDAFLAGGEVQYFEGNYQTDHYDAYFRVAARRLGEGLLVSFTTSTALDRGTVEVALRESQAREQAARAEAEAERQRFYDVLQQLPAQVATYHGPDHRFAFVNSRFEAFVPAQQLLGRPVREAAQGAVGEEVFALLDRVYATGEVVQVQEVEVQLAPHQLGYAQPLFINASYHPLRDAAGNIYGVLDFSYDVTEQVLAHRQVEQLNQELESRVQARTQELADQKQQLGQILAQVPAAIATLEGPEHRFAFANTIYRTIVGDRAAVGQPTAEAQPEMVGQGFVELLDRVYTTGEPYLGREIPVRLHDAATGAVDERYIDFSYQPLRDEQGRTTGILTFAVDETEKVLARRQAETLQAALLAVAERRAQEQQDLYQIFEQAPAAIVLLRAPDHRIEYVNPAYQQFYPGVTLRGRLLVEAHPRVAGSETLARLDRVYATGQPAQTRYFNFTYQPYREQGRIVGVSIFAYDVTEAALTRRQAARQARQFQELYEQAPMAVTILRGPEFIVELANPAILRIWGLTAEESLGRPRLELIPETSRASLRAVLETAYRTRQTHHVQEFPVVLGRTHSDQPDLGYFNFIYQPLLDEQGEPVALTCVGIEVTEQVLARQAVEASARQLRLITDALPVLIGYLDREERYQFANEAYRTWFNQDPQALLGRPVRELVGEAAYAGVKQYIDRALAGERVDFESQMPYREGLVKYLRTSYVPDERDGQRHGFYTLVTDITEPVLARQQVEQLNQELETRVAARTQEAQAAQAAAERQRGELERVFEQAPVAIAVFRGANYTIELANPTIAHLWDRTRDQLLGRGVYEVMPEAAGMGYEELMDGVMATGVPYAAREMESRHERNGRLETLYWDFGYVPMYAADGRTNGVMVVATDTTAQVLARRQVEQINQELESRVQQRTQQLEAQRGELQRLFEQVPFAIVVLRGPTFLIEQVNTHAEAIWGRSAAEVLGRPHFEALPDAAGQGYEELLTGVLQSGTPLVLREVPIALARAHTDQPTVGYYNIVFKPLRDEQQHVSRIVVMWTEATDQVLARQQVQELNQELAAINEELTATNAELNESNTRLLRTNADLDTFVYTASHDLKAPITNIEGILNALRETLPALVQQDETVAHLLNLLDHTVGRFLTTISQLTDLSRLQQTYNEPAELLHLAPVVADVLADLAPPVSAAQAQVHLDVPAGLQVSFAPASLRSIVYNLLSNAVKYRSPERPAQVWLQAAGQDGQVVLTVRDNGLGLTEAQQQRLFGVFQRLHTHVEGTGVGLYMIKRLIENAGATITVTSSPGVGSTFTVAFAA